MGSPFLFLVRSRTIGARLGRRGGGSLRQGTFYPELALGAGALSYNRKLELQQFLVAVVEQRRSPLHLANLWNALYFNYDLGYKGFRADHLEPKRIPTRTAGALAFALPIGGFLRVHTEAACGDLLAEVIYKEGAHADLGDGWIDHELSGAPATVTEEVAGQPVAIVRERFVLDFRAFGPDGNRITPKQYERLCNHARWLDEHGHLMMEAMYSPSEAGLEDLDYYADYLMKEHREGLLAFCFSEELSDDELREALLRSFDAVREIASDARGLRAWRDKYFFLAAGYQARLADGDGVLGRDDLRTIYRGLTRVPAGVQSCYSPIGPRIVDFLANDGMTLEEEALVRGCAYVTAVCHANAYVVDTLAREQRTGVLQNGVHLRLDDDWQAGGIWRAEHVADPERYSLKAVPPVLPLGLGYAESDVGLAMAETYFGDEQPLAPTETGFSVPLTLRDRALGRLRLSPQAAAALAPGVVEIGLRHGEAHDRRTVERDGTTLYGIEYPWDCHPGIVLSCNVESGGSVVRIRTLPVAPPVGTSDGKCYDYETNLAVYEREMGLKELTPKEKSDAPSLTELINRAFRLRGRRREDGARALALGELATVILGPTWQPGDTRPIAKALATMELERDGAYYLWRARVTRRTRSSDRSLLSAYGEAEPQGRLARTVHRHWVPMHVRRYDEYSGRSPSASKRATYAEARTRFGMHGVLPEELPEDCTWVEPYSSGGDKEEPTMSQLELVDPDGTAAASESLALETLAE